MYVNHGNFKTIQLLLQQIEFLQMVLDLILHSKGHCSWLTVWCHWGGKLHYPIPCRHRFFSLRFGLRKSIQYTLNFIDFLDVRHNLTWHFTIGVPRSIGPQHHQPPDRFVAIWIGWIPKGGKAVGADPFPPLDGNLRTLGINGKRLPGGLDRHQQYNFLMMHWRSIWDSSFEESSHFQPF